MYFDGMSFDVAPDCLTRPSDEFGDDYRKNFGGGGPTAGDDDVVSDRYLLPYQRQDEEEVRAAVPSGVDIFLRPKICGEKGVPPNVLLREFTAAFRQQLASIDLKEDLEECEKLQEKVKTLELVADTLLEQNEELVTAVLDLEREAEQRVTQMEKRLHSSARTTKEVVLHLNDWGQEIKHLLIKKCQAEASVEEVQNQLSALRVENSILRDHNANLCHDIQSLLKIIHQARSTGHWEMECVTFCEISPEEVYGPICGLSGKTSHDSSAWLDMMHSGYDDVRSPKYAASEKSSYAPSHYGSASQLQDAAELWNNSRASDARSQSDVQRLQKKLENYQLELLEKDKLIANLEGQITSLNHEVTVKNASCERHLLELHLLQRKLYELEIVSRKSPPPFAYDSSRFLQIPDIDRHNRQFRSTPSSPEHYQLLGNSSDQEISFLDSPGYTRLPAFPQSGASGNVEHIGTNRNNIAVSVIHNPSPGSVSSPCVQDTAVHANTNCLIDSVYHTVTVPLSQSNGVQSGNGNTDSAFEDVKSDASFQSNLSPVNCGSFQGSKSDSQGLNTIVDSNFGVQCIHSNGNKNFIPPSYEQTVCLKKEEGMFVRGGQSEMSLNEKPIKHFVHSCCELPHPLSSTERSSQSTQVGIGSQDGTTNTDCISWVEKFTQTEVKDSSFVMMGVQTDSKLEGISLKDGEKNQELESMRERLIRVEEKAASKDMLISQLQAHLETITKEVELKDTALENVERKLSSSREECSSLKNDKVALENKIELLQLEITDICKSRDNVQENLNAREHYIQEMKQHEQHLQNQKRLLMTQLDSTSEEMIKYRDEATNLHSQLSSKLVEIEQLNTTVGNLQRAIVESKRAFDSDFVPKRTAVAPPFPGLRNQSSSCQVLDI